MKDQLTALKLDVPAGGGPFSITGVSVGVFLTDQPTHRIAVGTDRRDNKPLLRNEGWILPAHCNGYCEFDDEHSFLSVELSNRLMMEVGLDPQCEFPSQVGKHDPLLLQLVKNVVGLPPDIPVLYRETMYRALAAHLAQLAQPARPGDDRIDDKRLRRAIAYIRDNLADNLSLEVLASEAAMSPFHFARGFKKATGKSPLQFVLGERIEMSKILLKTTRLSVAEIAFRVGYTDNSRFSQHFKRLTGVTPAVFRSS